jgi:molybdate transport system substrate-binding protein
MHSRTISSLLLVVGGMMAFGPSLAQTPGADDLAKAPAGNVRLFVSGGMRAPALGVRSEIEKATGRPVSFEFGESRSLETEIRAGKPFDAALLTTSVTKELVQGGYIVAESAAPVSIVKVGVSVRGSAPALDVGTPDGLRAAILGAHGVRRYYGVAASTPIVDNLFKKLGVGDGLKGKTIVLGSGALPPEAPLSAGQYELIINLIPAILPMKGWTYLGPIPDEFQMPLEHSAGVSSKGDQKLGRRVVAMFKSPAFTAALKANGSGRP